MFKIQSINRNWVDTGADTSVQSSSLDTHFSNTDNTQKVIPRDKFIIVLNE